MIILSRRRFLIGPAIIAASSLMPGHSIAKLLAPKVREFVFMFEDPMSRALLTRETKWEDRVFYGEESRGPPHLAHILVTSPVRMTVDEVKHHFKRKLGFMIGGPLC